MTKSDIKIRKQIRAAAATGEFLDLRRSRETAAHQPDDWPQWTGPQIEGSWIVDLLTDDSSPIHRRGLRLRGLRILGDVDLSESHLAHTLHLE